MFATSLRPRPYECLPLRNHPICASLRQVSPSAQAPLSRKGTATQAEPRNPARSARSARGRSSMDGCRPGDSSMQVAWTKIPTAALRWEEIWPFRPENLLHWRLLRKISYFGVRSTGLKTHEHRFHPVEHDRVPINPVGPRGIERNARAMREGSGGHPGPCCYSVYRKASARTPVPA